ncbi:hypothetical protein MMC34_001170 [Xylographa carneopallida]|nr:hypothetical protein [Xylographa carneopallida]
MSFVLLPPEILDGICSYIDVTSLSFVSKRVRAVALKFILSRLKLSFPGDHFEAILGFLMQSNHGRHVRTLVLDAQETSKATWQHLIEFLRCLTGLKIIECREDTALSLLAVWDHRPPWELFVRGFQLRGRLQGEDYQLNPKFRLLAASCLTSLVCDVGMLDLKRGSTVIHGDEDEEDEENEGEEEGAGDELDQDLLMAQAESLHIAKVVSFLTSVAPNLRRLDVTRNYWYGSIEIPKRRARRAKLVHFDFFDTINPQPLLFERLQKSIDFEALESLSLPYMSELTYEWLDDNPMSLSRLKELKMYIPMFQEHAGDSWKHVENLLMNVPPLKKLQLVGKYTNIRGNCLEHHSTLETLTLHEKDDVLDMDFTTGIDLRLLKDILRWKNLTFLDIQVHRSRRDGRMWRMLQDSPLETLILTFESRPKWIDSTFENRKEALEYAAIDEALARSIYDVCGLERLVVRSTSTWFQAFATEDENTVRALLHELTGSYEVSRVEGRVHVVELARQRLPADDNAIKLDSEIMDVFRSIWPSKGGSWKDDWCSLPLVVDM